MLLALRQSISILTTVRHGLLPTITRPSFLGGNPFYLLKSWRACGAESILEEFLKDEKRLIGCSAGRFVMQCSIAFIARCTPEMINPPACWTPPGFV
ncbi:Type 1 glutamine amidotransferase-like domain-containing protein [Ruthenibacterium sp.]|uniref:Type 1 glutamine amidotransferase-like domain-containing protein n=1 Tax=Ruthenibacterium sp. TaxID=1905345 RepID=UPI00338D4DA2